MNVAAARRPLLPPLGQVARLPVVGRGVAVLRDPAGLVGACVMVVLALATWFGPSLLPAPTTNQDLSQALHGSSSEHWLGTDQVGRDLTVRLLHGMRTSWGMVMSGTAAALVAGIAAGMAAGHLRRVVEPVLLRLLDVLLAIPNFILALLIAALLGAGPDAVTIALFARAFPVFVRVSHVATRSVLAQEFVHSAKVLGARPLRIVVGYVLPNVVAPCIALLPVMFGGGLLIAASLSFFGLGVQAPDAELGLMIAEGQRYMHLAPALLWAPGILLIVNNIALSLVGTGIRRALDPVQQQALGRSTAAVAS